MKMVFYFLLVAIANIFVALHFVWEMQLDHSFREEVTRIVESIVSKEQPVEYIFTVLDALTRKFIIMAGVLIIVSATVLFLFVIQIASPIQYMINMSKKIAQGDLSASLDMKSEDEIADLGNLINDLTVNLQEVIVQLQNMYANFEEASVCINAKLAILPEIREYFEAESNLLKENVENMAMIQESFTLYHVKKLRGDQLSVVERSLLNTLLERKIITDEQYQQVSDLHNERGGFIGAIVMELGFLDEKELIRYLSMG